MTNLKRAGLAIAAVPAAAAAAWGGYVAGTWLRYGKVKRTGAPAPLLDRFMPTYEVSERHETRVRAPADLVWEVGRGLDIGRSPLVRGIFAGRELLMRARPAESPPAGDFLSQVLALGWRVLAEEPGREIVVGAVTRPWEPNVVFRGLEPEEFARFAEPGYAQIVWNVSVLPAGADGAVFSTETRVRTTDAESRRRFRRYWSVFSPGIVLIRAESLRLVRREVRRRMVARGEPAKPRPVAALSSTAS